RITGIVIANETI
ncbi:hypothetical protein JL09_g6864, partial [Pichia kudriavzevii]